MRFRFALAGLLLLVGDPYAEGVRAFRDGRLQDAYDAFSAAELAAGDCASPELLFNRGVAAVQIRRLRVAEYTVEKMVVRGGENYAPIRDFLLGNIAFCRAERAAAESDLRDADPTALGRAIRHTRAAIRSWQHVAMRSSGPPQARRNIERARARLAELEQKRTDAEDKRRSMKKENPRAQDPVSPRPQETERAPLPQPESAASPLQLILSQLRQLQRDKRAARQSRRRARSAAVERDW